MQNGVQVGQPSTHISFGFEGWFWSLWHTENPCTTARLFFALPLGVFNSVNSFVSRFSPIFHIFETCKIKSIDRLIYLSPQTRDVAATDIGSNNEICEFVNHNNFIDFSFHYFRPTKAPTKRGYYIN